MRELKVTAAVTHSSFWHAFSCLNKHLRYKKKKDVPLFSFLSKNPSAHAVLSLAGFRVSVLFFSHKKLLVQ